MRPVNKPANNAWPPKTHLTFAGANATAIRGCLNQNGSTFTVADCLDLWLAKVKGTGTPGGCSAARLKVAVNAIKNQVNNVYKLASVPLTEALGSFCGYCGSPLSGLLEVEHCIPKAVYPTFSLTWANFLPACGPCNNAKGNNPKRPKAKAWMGNPPPVDPTEIQYYNVIRQQHYVWPDLDADSFRYLPVVLQVFNAHSNAWEDAHPGWAYNVNNEVLTLSIANRTVTARLFSPDNNQSNDVAVRVTVGTANARATEMVDLCKFNTVGNVDSTYDRRMLNRTLAWFQCLKALKRVVQAPDLSARNALWEALIYYTVPVGFYSVWLQVIRSVVPNAATADFIQRTNHPFFFPNTNTTHLP